MTKDITTKDKRYNLPITTEQIHYLDSVLTKKDIVDFKELLPELKDTWLKKQGYRTETEMRISVLNDGRYPTKGSKYWQCVREQDVMFHCLVELSFDVRINDIEQQQLKEKAAQEKDELKKELLDIEVNKRTFHKANMEWQAKERMREIKLWSKIKKELDDGSFDTQDVNVHQTRGLSGYLHNKKKELNENSNNDEIFNIMSQVTTVERLLKEGILTTDEKAVSHDKKTPELSK